MTVSTTNVCPPVQTGSASGHSPTSSPQVDNSVFTLDIRVERVCTQKTRADGNTYTTACNCTSTTSCIDDERAPGRCPDSD